MKIEMKHDSLFSTPEAAIILEVSKATIRKWVKDGKLILGHPVSNQTGFLIVGSSMRELLKGNPRYSWMDDSYDIPDEFRVEYLMAAKDKCMRELSAAETAMRNNRTQLDFILDQLFK